MKAFKVILTILGCAIIALGAWSAASFVMQRDFAPSQEETAAVPEPEGVTDEEPVETEPVEEAEEEPGDVEEEARLARAQELLDGMSLNEKIYQLMFLAPEAITGVPEVTQAGEATKAALDLYPVGGIVYSQTNLEDSDQARELTGNTLAFMEENGDIAPFIGIYDDGSTQSPVVGYLEGEQLDTFSAVGETGNGGQATQLAVEISKALTDYHFNANFASGAELGADVPGSFGADSAEVATMITSYVEGLQSQNVAAVLGHFPGEGSAVNAECDKTKEEFLESDILPFIAGISADAAMIQVSNMTATNLDDVPCCLSGAVMTDLLRSELGYPGIILTDPLGGVTISSQYDPNEAAVLALEAGADMLYGLTDPEGAFTEILTALDDGRLTEARLDESILRILTAKLKLGIIE